MATEEQVRESLKSCMDPELKMDIITLGLVYRIRVEKEHVDIEMTFTSMLCPYGPALVDEVKGKVIGLEGVRTVDVQVVFDPPWKPSEEVLASLGL